MEVEAVSAAGDLPAKPDPETAPVVELVPEANGKSEANGTVKVEEPESSEAEVITIETESEKETDVGVSDQDIPDERNKVVELSTQASTQSDTSVPGESDEKPSEEIKTEPAPVVNGEVSKTEEEVDIYGDLDESQEKEKAQEKSTQEDVYENLEVEPMEVDGGTGEDVQRVSESSEVKNLLLLNFN